LEIKYKYINKLNQSDKVFLSFIKMSKYPCGICAVGVKHKGILCTGTCSQWYHSKCLDWPDKKFNKLSETDITTWQCNKCKADPETNKTGQTSSNSNVNGETPIQTKNEMEGIKLKVRSIQDPDDLETSLTLAAEVGNALLAENSKLKQELLEVTTKISQMSQNPAGDYGFSEITYQMQIEELETEKETLTNRNDALKEIISEVEHQLSKERQFRSELVQNFEEQDREKEEVIATLEKEIKQLKGTINKLRQKETVTTGQISNSAETTDAQTQTDIMPDDLNESNELLKEITQLKTRQDQMELSMKALQNKVQQCDSAKPVTNTAQGCPTAQRQSSYKSPTLSSNKGSMRRVDNRHISVSLQVAKSKAAQRELINIKHNTDTKSTNQISSTSDNSQNRMQTTLKVFNMTGGKNMGMKQKPPMNAKPRAKEESLEEFYTKNINYYIKLMPNCSELTESTEIKTTTTN